MARVLLIEDDLFLRDIYTDYLKNDGHDVVVAMDGAEGMTQAMSGKWDLMLIDENLPKIMGVDVLRKARKAQPPVAKRIVFLTNEQKPTDLEDDRLKLSDAYLIKSEFSPKELITKLHEFLA